MVVHAVLFFAANPHGSRERNLTEETVEIQLELKMERHRDDFRLDGAPGNLRSIGNAVAAPAAKQPPEGGTDAKPLFLPTGQA